MRLCFSAGHSYKAEGATGGGYKEHAEAVKICDKALAECERRGIEAYSATSEASTQAAYLYDQCKLANAGGADVATQVHFNAYNGSASGVEVWYKNGDNAMRLMAEELSARIATITGLANRGAKGTDTLYWLNNTRMHALLVEACFIDNAGDMAATVGHYDEIASAMVDAMAGEEGGDMASVEDIVSGVFHEPMFDGFEGKPKAAVWGPDGEGTGNGYSQLGNVLRYIYDNTIETKQKLAELEAAFAVSGAQPVKAQPAAADIDYDLLAEKVVERLASRLAE